MSDISFTVDSQYSGEFAKSSENTMEEGGDNGQVESNSSEGSGGSDGDDSGSYNHSGGLEHNDGQSGDYYSEDTMDKISAQSSIISVEDIASVNESDSQGSLEHSDLNDTEDQRSVKSVHSERSKSLPSDNDGDCLY